MNSPKQALLRLVPAFYHIGMWRVQYLQKVCCVCHINLAVSHQEHSTLECSFFSSLLCEHCHSDIAWLPPVFKTNLSFTLAKNESAQMSLTIKSIAPHTGYIRDAIIAFKYLEQVSALPVLVHSINQLPRPQGCHATNSVLLAIPTTSQRLSKRGFDPVSVLVHYLSLHWRIPVWGGVSRVDETRSQQGLDRFERQKNIVDAFRINAKPPTRRVLLFDDVVTTGATLSALASTLKSEHPEVKLQAFTISHGS